MVIAEEVFEMYSRDILECIECLFGDPEFTSQLILSPERHYADANKTQRLFHEMNTGKWWWSMQVRIYLYHVYEMSHMFERLFWRKKNLEPLLFLLFFHLIKLCSQPLETKWLILSI